MPSVYSVVKKSHYDRTHHHDRSPAPRRAVRRARVRAGWNDLLTEQAGKQVLVVCHAGVIRMALAHALNLPLAGTYRIDVPSAGLTRIKVQGIGDEAHHQLLFHHGKL